MFSDDRGLEMKAASLQDRASFDQYVETFFRNEPSHAECTKVTVFLDRISRIQQQVGEFRVQAVVDAANVCVWLDPEQVFTIRIRAGNDKTRRAHFAPQQSGRVERATIDVFGVSRERERQAGDDRGEPRDCGRAMTEMRVDVLDVLRLENELRGPNCLEKFFQVQLSRRGEETAACSHGLRECNHRRTSKTGWLLFANTAKRRQEIAEVQREPASQGRLR